LNTSPIILWDSSPKHCLADCPPGRQGPQRLSPSTAPYAYVATVSVASVRIEDRTSLEDHETAASAWPPQAGPPNTPAPPKADALGGARLAQSAEGAVRISCRSLLPGRPDPRLAQKHRFRHRPQRSTDRPQPRRRSRSSAAPGPFRTLRSRRP